MDPHSSIAVLYQRHAYLIGELARVNNEIDVLEKKKGRLDQLLEGDVSLLRVKRRKMKQSRYITNRSLQKVQREQTVIIENVRATEAEMTAWQVAGVNRLMAQYQYSTSWASPYLQYFPLSAQPCLGTAFDIEKVTRNSEPQWPPNWDHAMMQLDEASMVQDFSYPQNTARSEAESGSVSSRPDSGFEEPPMYMMPFDLPINYDASQHVYSHENFYQAAPQVRAAPMPPQGTVVPRQIFSPPVSAMPRLLEEMISPRTTTQPQSAPLPATSGASNGLGTEPQDTTEPAQHKRRYSEAAVELLEHRLSGSENNGRKHSRNRSSGNLSDQSRWSISSSAYSAATPTQGQRASLNAIEEGQMGAASAEVQWLE